MKKSNKKILSTAMAIAMISIMAIPVLAATTNTPSGGRWDYGVNNSSGGTVWSNYYHPTKTHKSSVQGSYFYSSPWQVKGTTTYASAPSRKFAVDHSYYDDK
ncbi:MAG: hypothetical protein KFW09_04770 [Oscillospiraceae bacterium]|nr:hypothetical protein [Oscillospiraceae bacterium]